MAYPTGSHHPRHPPNSGWLCGTSAAGESGVLAITAGQLASFRIQLQRYGELARAVAHGMAIGHQAHCLMARPMDWLPRNEAYGPSNRTTEATASV